MKQTIFEHVLHLDERQYASIWKLRRKSFFRTILCVVIGLVCFLSKYTIVIGILIVALCILGLFVPKLSLPGIRSNWKGHKYLHQKLLYGLTTDGLMLKGETIEVKMGWPLLVTWQISGDWLILSPSGGPQMFFPVSKMQSEGVFDEVMALVKKYGKEFR